MRVASKVAWALAGVLACLGIAAWLRRTPDETPRPRTRREGSTVAHTPPSAGRENESSANVSPPVPTASAIRVDPSRPESEEIFWHELERLHSSDKPRALVLARKGDDWYSAVGKPAEARKAMIVTLLVDLGRMEDARVLARRFIAAYPDSPYRPLVQGVTGIHPRPHGPGAIEY
jgi:hypothetical protein